MPYNDMMQGFRKWKERTTTSPSRRHLGIYKALLKDNTKTKTKNEQINKTHPTMQPPHATGTESSQPPEWNGSDIVQLIHKLLVMAVRHCHTFQQWQIIWNLFIEKDIGNPQTDWLQMLHIIEANYNLLLKWFGPKGVLKWAETYNQLTNNQGRCRKGCSAIDMACKKVCTFELICLLHLIAINVDIDALACFDMMIEACQNLSCLSQGKDPCYIRLHRQMHWHTQYYPKHSFGVSDRFNQHSDEHPWYSAGQGTGYAVIHWSLISHSLILAYQLVSTPWCIKSVIQDIMLTLRIDAFVDDTNMIHGDTGNADIGKLLQIVQTNFHTWEGLLQASGRTLNPQKCSWTPLSWSYNNLGHAHLTNPNTQTTPPLQATDLQGNSHVLCINKPSKAVWLLGVHITADGNHQKKLHKLKQKQMKYIQFLLCTPLSHQEAQVVYKQCYLPTVMYPLPATNMPPAEIYTTQQTVTSYPNGIPMSPTTMCGVCPRRHWWSGNALPRTQTGGTTNPTTIMPPLSKRTTVCNHYQPVPNICWNTTPNSGGYKTDPLDTDWLDFIYTPLSIYQSLSDMNPTPMDPPTQLTRWPLHHGWCQN